MHGISGLLSVSMVMLGTVSLAQAVKSLSCSACPQAIAFQYHAETLSNFDPPPDMGGPDSSEGSGTR
jgi:hypothetical protein